MSKIGYIWDGFEWLPAAGTVPEKIKLKTVVRGLPRISRWQGQTSMYWSVAHHSVLAYLLAKIDGCSNDLLCEVLLHDAVEAYVGDMGRGLKLALPEYAHLEQEWYQTVARRFGVPEAMSDQCEYYDNFALTTEMRDLLPEGCQPPDYYPEPSKDIRADRFALLNSGPGPAGIALEQAIKALGIR